MEYKYLITDIQAKTKVSITSLTTFKKKHQEFFNQNSTRIQRKIYYNQAAMDFFLSYYQPDRKAEDEKIPVSDIDTDTDKKEPDFTIKKICAEGQEKQAEKAPIEATQTDEPPEGQTNALERKIDALEAEIEALRKQLSESEAEKKELLRQNGEVLLLLQMEKQEKQLLLPAPKKALVERIKSLFHKG